MRVEIGKAAFRSRLLASCAAAAAVMMSAPDAHGLWSPFGPPSFSSAEEQFEHAQSLERGEQYRKAMDAYQKVVDDFPSSPFAAEAQFRVAEMLEKTRYFYHAFNAYQAVLDNFPSYPKVNLILNRQFRIGNLFLQGKSVGFLRLNPAGSYKRAINIYQKILSNAPFSELAPNAQYNLGMAYLESKKYTEAAIEFEKIPIRYPHSEFVGPARYQLGVCAYKQAVAAPYDQEAAQEALNRLREYIEGHPGDSSIELAKEMMVELQGRKAASIYQIGRFYEERGNPKAALIYLNEIVRDYPLTRYAEKARKVASREERKLEAVDAVRSAQDKMDEIRRLVASQRSAIARIKSKGRTKWTFWRYVIPQELTADEHIEIDEREEEIEELEGRLAVARLELSEKQELMHNRLRLIRAEAEIEKIEEDLRAAQVDLQVAQGKLAGIGELPEAESPILEAAAASIAAKEEVVRKKEADLERLRGEMERVTIEAEEGRQRVEERYEKKRAALLARTEGERAAPARRWWWPYGSVPAPAPAPEGPAAQRPQEAESPPAWRWSFGREKRGDDGEVLERCEVIYREAEESMSFAERSRFEEKWNEALGSYDRASLKLMQLRGLWPEFRKDEVSKLLQKCRNGMNAVRASSARQQYTELAAELEERVRRNQGDAEALLSLGDLRRGHGDPDGAIAAYLKAAALKPEDARTHFSLGVAYTEKKDIVNAATSLRKAVEAEPGNARAHHALGLVLKEMGDYEGCRRELERAIEADPSYPPAYFSLGHLYQSALGDREKAGLYWRKYLQIKPDDPLAPVLAEWLDQGQERTDAPVPTAEEQTGKKGKSLWNRLLFWQKGTP